MMSEVLQSLRGDAEEWAAGRSWMVRLPLLLYLGYVLIRHLGDPLYGSLLFGGVTFGIHELGHVIFGFAGTFLSIAGGTVAQIAAPVAAAVIFLRQRDYFGISVAAAWLSFSLFNVATYMADAREMDLPLLGVGAGEPVHDWNYLLGKLGLLSHDDGVAAMTRLVAFLIGALALAMGGWLCLKMFRSSRS